MEIGDHKATPGFLWENECERIYDHLNFLLRALLSSLASTGNTTIGVRLSTFITAGRVGGCIEAYYLKPSQTRIIERFCEKYLTAFSCSLLLQKSSVIDIWLDSGYTLCSQFLVFYRRGALKNVSKFKRKYLERSPCFPLKAGESSEQFFYSATILRK